MTILAFLISVTSNIGYPVMFLMVMAESSGVPIPGETALLVAAFLASSGKLQIEFVIPLAAAAAIVGDNIGYLIGRKGGRWLLERPGASPVSATRCSRPESRSSTSTVPRPCSSAAGCWACACGRHGWPARRRCPGGSFSSGMRSAASAGPPRSDWSPTSSVTAPRTRSPPSASSAWWRRRSRSPAGCCCIAAIDAPAGHGRRARGRRAGPAPRRTLPTQPRTVRGGAPGAA